MSTSRLLFSLSLFLVLLTDSFSSLQVQVQVQVQPLCHEDESSALLQFKESFIINKSASSDPMAYPKVASWKVEGDSRHSPSDCCSWDGVECNKNTGHVIGLDLSSSCLFGSINSNNSLFRLVHLQKLNLAFNHFNYSHIPSTVGNLSRLTYLNLSYSVFFGPIPSSLFRLVHLEELDLADNDFNYSHIPSLVGNLNSIHVLSFSNCNISGPIPSSFGNLTQLTYLHLSHNCISGRIPSSLGNLTQLTFLHLSQNNISGPIPSSLFRLVHLEELDLADNDFNYSHIPSIVGNLNSVHILSFFNCHISGPIPSSFGNLTQLTYLDLSSNYLSGTVEIEVFLKQTNFDVLHLSYNKLSLLTKKTNSNATLPQFHTLGLASCNLIQFPDFLRNQHRLSWLDLNSNKLQGLIPRWMYHTSIEALRALILSYNNLTGFEQSPVVLPWSHVEVLELQYNKLQGSLPIPPPSTNVYDIQQNELIGEISPLICSMSSLEKLDLSNNKLSGILPSCLGNFSSSLSVLELRSNNFYGTIPDTWESSLKVIDFNENQLEGQLPRSLSNCTMLEFLDVGNNQINDTFPFWLGNLPQLKVLVLRSNRFYGAIRSLETNYMLPNLHIIDLSHNGFTGKLPSGYFLHWNAMKVVDANQLQYMRAGFNGDGWGVGFDYSISITNKGILLEYQKILDFFIIIDLSSNKFEGDIPRVIGNLKALNLLNLSNNVLTGPIPLSLGNLTNLEALDLSQNKLSREIPTELTQLTFLEVFTVSHNYLEGPIPHGKQFDTFLNTSFEGNSGLCGNPLSKKCENSKEPPSPSTFEENQDSESPFEFGWKVVVIGYACGLVVGVVIGQIVITRNHDWFMKTFATGQLKKRRANRRVRRN